MKPEEFSELSPGLCQKTIEGHFAFFPDNLPPKLNLDWDLMNLVSEADRAIGELSGAGQLLPNPHLLIRPYLRREAILSSRIEDTHADMGQLALFEEEEELEEQGNSVQEVANYVWAIETGLSRIKELPISIRLVKELHEILLKNVRGGELSNTPGEFRTRQNWIGPRGCNLREATFVPPPHTAVGGFLSEWEKYIHADTDEPTLIKAALIHYQFEAIHPFLDGNGRIGRLLITLFLCEQGCLSQPLLYLSGFFDETRDEYYRLLLMVSRTANWEDWVKYFLRGVRQQAKRALKDTRRILEWYELYRNEIKSSKRVPREATRMLDQVFGNPLLSIHRYADRNNVSYQNTQRSVQFWIKKGLLKEITGRQRYRVYIAEGLIRIMETS